MLTSHPYMKQDREKYTKPHDLDEQFSFQKPQTAQQYQQQQYQEPMYYQDDYYNEYGSYYNEPLQVPEYQHHYQQQQYVYHEPIPIAIPINTIPINTIPITPPIAVRLPMREVQRYAEYPFRQPEPEDTVVKYLIDMAIYEQQLEDVRIELASQEDFRISVLFGMIDANETGEIIIEEVLQVLLRFGIMAAQLDVFLVFEEYGVNECLNAQSFEAMVLPITGVISYCKDTDKPSMLPQTKLLIRKLWITLLNAESAAECHRMEIQKLIQDNSLDIQTLYSTIFRDRNQQRDLKQYLYSHGHYFKEQIITGLFRRFDRNNTNVITPQEFERQLTPRTRTE